MGVAKFYTFYFWNLSDMRPHHKPFLCNLLNSSEFFKDFSNGFPNNLMQSIQNTVKDL